MKTQVVTTITLLLIVLLTHMIWLTIASVKGYYCLCVEHFISISQSMDGRESWKSK